MTAYHKQRTRYQHRRPARQPNHYNPCAEYWVTRDNIDRLPRQIGDQKLPKSFWDSIVAIAQLARHSPCDASTRTLAHKANCCRDTLIRDRQLAYELGLIDMRYRARIGKGRQTMLCWPVRSGPGQPNYWSYFGLRDKSKSLPQVSLLKRDTDVSQYSAVIQQQPSPEPAPPVVVEAPVLTDPESLPIQSPQSTQNKEVSVEKKAPLNPAPKFKTTEIKDLQAKLYEQQYVVVAISAIILMLRALTFKSLSTKEFLIWLNGEHRLAQANSPSALAVNLARKYAAKSGSDSRPPGPLSSGTVGTVGYLLHSSPPAPPASSPPRQESPPPPHLRPPPKFAPYQCEHCQNSGWRPIVRGGREAVVKCDHSPPVLILK